MPLRIRIIEPVGNAKYVDEMAEIFARAANPGTEVEVVSLINPHCQHHLEYQSYEALVVGDIVKIARDTARHKFDGLMIGCFYDPGLVEAREISGETIVTAPCQASLETVANLANKFSIIIGRRKWQDRMEARVREYGYGHALASFRCLGLGVEDFQKNHDETERRMIEASRKAIDEDGAEAIILGCTMEFGFYQKLQDILGVPVIDCALAAFKRAEHLAELKQRFGWKPSRVWGCEPPPEDTELKAWKVFDEENPPIGQRSMLAARRGG